MKKIKIVIIIVVICVAMTVILIFCKRLYSDYFCPGHYDLGDFLSNNGLKTKHDCAPRGSLIDVVRNDGGRDNPQRRLGIAKQHAQRRHDTNDDEYDCLVHVRVGDMLSPKLKNLHPDKVNGDIDEIVSGAETCNNILLLAGRHRDLQKTASRDYVTWVLDELGRRRTTVRYTETPNWKRADEDFITIATFKGRLVTGKGNFYRMAADINNGQHSSEKNFQSHGSISDVTSDHQ